MTVTTAAAGQTAMPDAQTFVLRWTAPAGCPSEEEVIEDVKELSANRRMATSENPVKLDAVVKKCGPNCWGLTLDVGRAERRLETGSCAQAARAAALFVLLLMDPSRDDGPAARDPLSIVSPPPSSGADAAPGRELSGLAAAAFLVDDGTLPLPEALGALEVGVRYRRVEITVQGAAGPTQGTPGSNQAGLRLRPITLALQPCYAPWRTNHLRLGACARGEVGWIHADSVDAAQPRTTDSPWVSVGGELVAWWIIGCPFEARLGAGAMVPVVRPNFQFDGYGDPLPRYLTRTASIYEPGMAGCGDIAAVVRF